MENKLENKNTLLNNQQVKEEIKRELKKKLKQIKMETQYAQTYLILQKQFWKGSFYV